MSTTLTTPVEIANLCLIGHYGKAAISSFTQSGQEAQKCAFFYPLALEEVAAASNWTFLRERAALAQAVNPYPNEYDFAYDRPSRALKLLYLVSPRRPLEKYKAYRLDGDLLMTNLSEAEAVYTTLQQRPLSSMTLEFKKAVAAKLAELLAPSFTRRDSDVNKFRVMAEQEIAKAIEKDAAAEHDVYTVDERYVYGNSSPYDEPASYDDSTFWRR